MRLALFVIFYLASCCASAAQARDPHPYGPYESTAPIAYMVDLSSGTTLFDKNADRQIPPASMAKMMTVYIAFQMLARGEITLDQKFTVTPEIWARWNGRGSTMYLKRGEEVSVADLLTGIITVSGNDAAVTLAHGIAGSETAFTDLMNEQAKRLGLNSSRFGTANGWPDGGQTLVTAQDLAKLATHLVIDHPKIYRQFFGLRTFTWNGVTQTNRNPIFGQIAGADGLKTGHTREAGYCFTGSAEQDGRRLIMVVAGLKSYQSRIDESNKFMQWGFNAWINRPLFKQGEIIAIAPVQLGTQTRISLVAPNNLSLTLPKYEKLRYSLYVRYKGPIKAPFKKDDVVAELVAKLSDGSERTMPLSAAKTVDRAGFWGRVYNGLRSIFGA